MRFFKPNLLLILFAIIGNGLSAQEYVLAKDSAITINITGTSTLHGWTVVAPEVINVPQTLTLTGEEHKILEAFGFEVIVDKMDGGRGASMNKKIMTALKGAEHPTIAYQQSEPVQIESVNVNGQFTLVSQGNLKIAGLEKKVNIEVKGEKIEDMIIFKGSHPLKFSELNIEPPSAMFGQIVCGDDIEVNFEFRYEK